MFDFTDEQKMVRKMVLWKTNKDGDGTSVQVIESAANQRELLNGEIFDGWRKIELAVKPWLDGVLIG